MIDDDSFLIVILRGACLGLIGFAVGIATFAGRITARTTFNYMLCSVISGGIVFQIVENSLYDVYKYGGTILIAYASLFIFKGFSVMLNNFSIDPLGFLKKIASIFRGRSK